MAEELREHFKLYGYADISLRKRVVYFSGDAGALGEDSVELPLGTQKAKAKDEDNESGCERG